MIDDRPRGFVLPGVLMILMLLLVFIPAFVWFIQKDTKATVAEVKKDKSLHLAEIGQDRGAWKLRESDTIWNNALGGTAVSNYDGTTEFTEVAGGRYKIQFSAGPGPGEVTVLSKGKAD